MSIGFNNLALPNYKFTNSIGFNDSILLRPTCTNSISYPRYNQYLFSMRNFVPTVTYTQPSIFKTPSLFSFNFPFFNFSNIMPSITQTFSNVKSTIVNVGRKVKDTISTGADYLKGCVSKIKAGLFKGTLTGKEGIVTALCQKYGIKDVGMVATMICYESGYGKSNLARHNNFMGYRSAGDLGKSARGFGYFSTVEKGLEAAIRNLSRYATRFKDVHAVDWANLDAIGRHYCSSNYANNVRKVYNSRVKQYMA